MSLYPFELQANLIQLILIVAMTVWFVVHNKGKLGMTKFLFFWGLLAYVLMNIYWVCMIFVDGSGNYATFTACDTATISFLLIWTTMFYRVNKVDIHSKYAKRMLPLMMPVFGIWNVFWWTLWTGNILINIIWGIPLFLLFYMVFYSLETVGAIQKIVKIIWITLSIILFVFEIPMYFYDRGTIIYVLSDWICAFAWLMYIVLFIYSAWKNKINRTRWMYAAVLHSMVAQYLTDGYKYSFFMMIETILLFFLIITFNLQQTEEGEI